MRKALMIGYLCLSCIVDHLCAPPFLYVTPYSFSHKLGYIYVGRNLIFCHAVYPKLSYSVTQISVKHSAFGLCNQIPPHPLLPYLLISPRRRGQLILVFFFAAKVNKIMGMETGATIMMGGVIDFMDNRAKQSKHSAYERRSIRKWWRRRKS